MSTAAKSPTTTHLAVELPAAATELPVNEVVVVEKVEKTASMGMVVHENKAKINNTSDLISQLKKVFSNTELKVVVQCLQKLKAAKDGVKDITGVLRNLKLVIFKDQKKPRKTDKRFDDKHNCIVQLAGFIPPKHRKEFDSYFEPFIGEPKATLNDESSEFE